MLEQIHPRILKTDLEYLRKISEGMGKGVLTWHIRNAVNQYVRKLKEEE
ncbi:MAG: hypothetical protein ACTSPI_08800 [Candidatus Heimdallarchaeaceae archaeon]